MGSAFGSQGLTPERAAAPGRAAADCRVNVRPAVDYSVSQTVSSWLLR